MTILSFKPNTITKNLLSSLKDRTKDIIIQRYGLGSAPKRKTLEAIGQQYGITRERIRQIENFALNSIRKNAAFETSQEAIKEIKSILNKKGKIISEKELLEYLTPDPVLKNHIFFLLVLADDFIKFKEDDELHHHWTVDNDIARKVQETLKSIHKKIGEGDAHSDEEIISLFKNHAQDKSLQEINEEIIRSWLNISKIIIRNAMGEWGSVSSPRINPRGVRDLSALVLRKHGSPMHFSEITDKISQFFSKPVHLATVHNELIKNPQFILVGRGLYALNEWGYKSGTVKDIIKNIIKTNGPLTKEEIVKNVLKERHVKENTILVNLQNPNYFKKNKEGKYVLA